MRARNIKPGFFSNDILGQLSPWAQLLFIGLWCMADRKGRLENRPLKIKAAVFPYRDCLSTDIVAELDLLAQHEFIVLYEANGLKLIQVVNFNKHQAPHQREKDSIYPPPPIKAVPSTVPSTTSAMSSPADVLIPDVLIPDSLIPDSLIPDSLISDSESAGTAGHTHDNPMSLRTDATKRMGIPPSDQEHECKRDALTQEERKSDIAELQADLVQASSGQVLFSGKALTSLRQLAVAYPREELVEAFKNFFHDLPASDDLRYAGLKFAENAEGIIIALRRDKEKLAKGLAASEAENEAIRREIAAIPLPEEEEDGTQYI